MQGLGLCRLLRRPILLGAKKAVLKTSVAKNHSNGYDLRRKYTNFAR